MLVAIGVDDFAEACSFEVEIHFEMEDAFSVQLRDEIHEHMISALDDAEDRHARSSYPACFAEFPRGSEVETVDGRKDETGIQTMGHNSHTQGGHRFIGGVVGYSELLGHAACGRFQLEELDEAQPLLAGEVAVVEKPHAEVVEGVSTSGTAAVPLAESIEATGAAFGTKALMVFPAKSQQEFFCRIFCFYNFFIEFKLHKQEYPEKKFAYCV